MERSKFKKVPGKNKYENGINDKRTLQCGYLFANKIATCEAINPAPPSFDNY